MGFFLHEKVALVTGASSGLGRHFAKVLAKAGAKVCISARRKNLIKELEEEIRDSGGEALAITMDVTKRKQISEGLARLEDHFGIPTVLVNNAGVVGTGLSLDVEEKEWDRVFDTNLKGAWRVAQEVARKLSSNNVEGSIINIASILAFGVSPGVAPYSISKAGIVHMTKVLALEWARYGIRVNALAPGYISTDLNRKWLASKQGKAMIKSLPQRRCGKLDDLSGPLLLLASEQSSYITGVTIPVDGGHLIKAL